MSYTNYTMRSLPSILLYAVLVSTHAFKIQPTIIPRCTTRNTKARPSLSSSQPSTMHMIPVDLSLLPDDPISTVLIQSSTVLSATADLSLRNSDVVVFIAGIIPFVWATIEFWRRIAVGEPFGTSKDSVVIVRPTTTIGQDGNPSQSRGRQTLGQGALIVAYLLFGVAAGVILLTLYSVLTSTPTSISSGIAPSLPLSVPEQVQSLL